MNVGLFSDYFFSRGDGTAVATQLSRDSLQARGHKVFIFCPSLPGRRPSAGVVTFRSVAGLLYPGLRLSWPLSRRNLDRVAALKLDVVHIETPLFVGLFGLWTARRLKVPSVITLHLDMDFMGEYAVRLPALAGLVVLTGIICRDPKFIRIFRPRRTDKTKRRSEDFAWRCMAYTASKADKVILPSQKNYDQIIKYIDTRKVRLVPNGMAVLPPSAERKTFGIELGDFVVISTARHVKEKQVDKIINGFARASLPKAKLVILNEGPKTSSLKKQALKLGLGSRVIFAGLQPREAVFNYLGASDVFVNASKREVASLGVLEAAATGLPLLLFDKRLVEPLEHSQNGYFVTSEESLAARLEELARSPAKRYKFQQKSLERAKIYSLKSHVKSLEAVYREVVTRPG